MQDSSRSLGSISWSPPSREGDPELRSVSLQPRQVCVCCRLRDQPLQRPPGLRKESEWRKSCAVRYACLTEPQMCSQPQKPHPLTEAAERLSPTQVWAESGDGDCWHPLISLNEAVKEWRGGGGGGRRHFHTSDNSWPVPRQEEWRLIRAHAIELRPEPIQLGVQHGEASVFKLLLQLSCQNESGELQKREYLDTAQRLWGIRLAYVAFQTRIGGRSCWDVLLNLHFPVGSVGGGAALLCSWWKCAQAWVRSGVIEENPSRLSWSRSPSVAKSICVKAHWNNELVRACVCVCVHP